MMRRALGIVGLALLAAAWLGPLPTLSATSFAAHMAMHMTVVGLAAPLIAIGITHGRYDPVPRAPWLFAPIMASIVELLVVWGWHAPLLHHAARHSAGIFMLEQASFLAVGLLLWISAFGGGGAGRPARAAAGIAGLLFTSMHMTLLGVLLTLAPRALYQHAAVAGVDPLQDQQVGGLLMLVVGGTTYLVGALYLLGVLLQREPGVDRVG